VRLTSTEDSIELIDIYSVDDTGKVLRGVTVIVCDPNEPGDSDQERADAALIAAAPALLRACRSMLEPFGRQDIGAHGLTSCPVCGWAGPTDGQQHAGTCPVPIAEAALALAQAPKENPNG
jgi:hypothetical protein